MDIGTSIKAAREAKGWTQRELADHLGVLSMQVSRWERGVAEPSIRRVSQIASLTNKPLISFFSEEDCKEKVA